MHGELKLKALDLLEKGILGGIDFFDDFLTAVSAPYGSSARHINYLVEKNRVDREAQKWRVEERQKIYDLLYDLKREGLVEVGVKDKTKEVKLTRRGFSILKKLRLRKEKALPEADYEVKNDKIVKIIAFDIPEKEKRKRQWLRKVLKNLRFQMIQKSVWVGTAGIPNSFIDDLIKLRIFNYIEILSVSKTGTLKRYS